MLLRNVIHLISFSDRKPRIGDYSKGAWVDFTIFDYEFYKHCSNDDIALA